MALLNADLNNYDSQEGFDCLPPGWYEAQVVDSEIKKGGKGPYINWTFQIAGKPNKIWDVMSLGSDISLKRLKTLAVCSGHPNPNFIADTEELHGLSCQVRLKIEKDDTGKYDDKNRISAFKPSKGNNTNQPPMINQAPPAPDPTPTAEPAAQAEPQAPAKKPWE